MSLLDKFKDQFVDRDDEDMEEEDLGEETAPVNPAQPVRRVRQLSAASAEVLSRVRQLSRIPWSSSAPRATVMRKRSGII